MDDDTTTFDSADGPAEPLFRRGAWGRLAMMLLPCVAVTGLVLSFLYRPDPAQAWWSVAAIRGGGLGLVRDLHRWGGELLLVAAWLPRFRVVMVGAYRRLPGWGLSVAGTVWIVLSAATGWLLRYDAAAARILDESGLPASGLPVVCVLHVLLLPWVLAFLLIPNWTAWKVGWKAGRVDAAEDQL